MEANRELTSDVVAALTARLTSRAVRGPAPIPREDVDDAVLEVLARLGLEELGPASLSRETRAMALLKGVKADYWRKRYRAREVPRQLLVDLDVVPAEELPMTDSSAESLAEFADSFERLRSLLGDDAAAYAILEALGFADAEIAVHLGWSRRRCDAVRKRVSRRLPQIAALLLARD